MKWKHAITGTAGTSHLATNTPCQDAWGSQFYGDTLVCVISDGAGSAKYSEIGSQIIVAETLRYFSAFFAGHSQIEMLVRSFDQETAACIVTELRNRLIGEALAIKTTIDELAGTILVGIFHPARSVFFQVGDGVWCASYQDVMGAVTWPHQGEYAGQTEFVTSSSARDVIQFASIEGLIDFAVGMSDGLERLSLNLGDRIPHSGFIRPLIQIVKADHPESLVNNSLKQLLESDRICSHTDDDKSIAIVTNG